VQHAQQPALDHQRNAQQRADLLLVQERVDRVARPQVPHDDRTLLGGDTAGEALADRHAEAALDFFLEAARRARNQLVRLLVEQEDRRGVGGQDLRDPVQQGGEQPVQVQVSQRSLCDPLEIVCECRWLVRGASQGADGT
jgi:hypothetical protein